MTTPERRSILSLIFTCFKICKLFWNKTEVKVCLFVFGHAIKFSRFNDKKQQSENLMAQEIFLSNAFQSILPEKIIQ